MKYTALIATFICLHANAQTGNEILQACRDRIIKLRSISYNIYYENAYEKTTADVLIKKGNEFPIFETAMIKLSGLSINDKGSKQVTFSYNGSSFDFIDPQSHETVTLDSPTYNKLSRTGMFQYTLLVHPSYWQKDPFDSFKDITAAEKMEDTVIFTEPCYKISITREINSSLMGKQSFQSVWYIGKKDQLLHGISSGVTKYFLRITGIDQDITNNSFVLFSSQPKKITGLEPISEGLLPVGNKAPLWTLASSRKDSISLSSLKGKVVLLDFWGTWCVPCIKAMPDIQSIYDHFKGKAVEVIGVSVEPEKAADPVDFMKKRNFTYPIIIDGVTITKPYKVVEFPTIYVIDKKGNIIHAEHGGNRENFKDDIISKIEKALMD